MPIKEETQSTSRQHPIPQNVMDVEFKVVGDLTVRQLMYLFAGGTFAYLIFRSDLQWFWRYTISFISVVGTVAIAFVPYEERGLDKWVVSFFKAMTMPTQMVWRKTYSPPAYFLSDYANIIKNEIITLTPAKSRNKLDDYLDTLSESQNDLDRIETERLRSIKLGFSSSLTTNVVLTQRNNNPSLGLSSAPSTYTDVTYIEDQSPGRIISETSQSLAYRAKVIDTPPINTPSVPQDQNQNTKTPPPEPPKSKPPEPKPEPVKPPEPPKMPEPIVVNATPIIVNIPAPVMQTPPPVPTPAPPPKPIPVPTPAPVVPAHMQKPIQNQQQNQKPVPKPHPNQLLDQRNREKRERERQAKGQFAAHKKPDQNQQNQNHDHPQHINIPPHMNKPQKVEPPKPAMLPEPNLPHAHRAPERPKTQEIPVHVAKHEEPKPETKVEPVVPPAPATVPIQVVIVPAPIMQAPPVQPPAPKPAPMPIAPPEPKMPQPVKPPEPPKPTIQVEIKPIQIQPVQQTKPPIPNNGPTPEEKKAVMKDIQENEMASKREFLTSVELKKQTIQPTSVDRAMVNIPSAPGGEIKIRTSTKLPKIIVVQDIKEIHAREALLAKKVKELLEVTKQVRDGLQNAPDKKMHIEQNKNRIDFFDTKYHELEKERASLNNELEKSKSNVQQIEPAEGKELHEQVENLSTKNDDLKDQLAMIQKELSILKTETIAPHVETPIQGGADAQTQEGGLAKVVKVEKVENRKPDPNNTENANIIAGTVKDKTGALIENAVVIIKDREGDAIRALKTNQLGRFRTQTPMQNGQYNVEVIKGGMKFDIISVEAFGESISPLSIIAYE